MMKARFLFWTGRRASELPIREMLSFSQVSDDVFEEMQEMFKNAVAAGVSEVLENMNL